MLKKFRVVKPRHHHYDLLKSARFDLSQAQRQISYGFKETGLRLLMRDGAVNVTFRPRFSAEQYAEFMAVLDHAPTKEELEIAGQKFADEHRLEFTCDDLSV